MQQTPASGRFAIIFWVTLALGAAFVWFSSDALPPTVASHFGPGGTVDGFMPQSLYRLIMLLMAAGAPAFLYWFPKRLFRQPQARINLPNRDHWLAPPRRAASIEFLSVHAGLFALMMTLFLCYVHWLVVLANRVSPPRLSPDGFFAGLAVYLIATGLWLLVLFRRFRRVA